MEINGLTLKTHPAERDGRLTLYVEGTVEQCAALDGETLTYTHYGRTLGVYPDYSVTSITAQDGYCTVTAMRKLDPATAATFTRLETAAQTAAEERRAQVENNESQQAEIDAAGDLLEAMLAAEEA